MEVEENQPPQKKLKQATLSFFKGKSETSLKESQGRKRHISSSSDSPNKAVKLSKPLTVLSSSDSPNSKLLLPSQKACNHESSDQEVSSSSEADSVGNKLSGKCLMDRFVKKIPFDSNQEISSTNNDLDNQGQCQNADSKTDKENCLAEVTKPLEENDNEEKTKNCIVLNDEDECKEVKVPTSNPDDFVIVSSGEEVANCKGPGNDCGTNEMKDVEDDDNFTAQLEKSVEMDTDAASFNTSLDEKVESTFTSTPIKPNNEASTSKNDLAAVSSGTSSHKKKARKIDLAKKAEKEVLRQKQKEEKEKERLEKKKKLEEEKAEKERLRKEQKEAKEKAKQEVKDKQTQEKLEKEKQKEEEKLKKEEERKIKEEQKQKKLVELEAKQEEKKKREEEKRQKEEEKQKEDDEKKKKEEKVKMAFQSFFKTKENSQKLTSNKSTTGFFVPFELKKDMHLAPTLRRDALCQEKRNYLDEMLNTSEPSGITYLDQLRSKEYKPKKTGRILRVNPKPADEVDLEIIHDSEALKTVFHKVKILKFHTDNRPPYCGTWRKQTKLNPRNPFKKDEDIFDYEIDSDDEWEEEEPGESLSCSDGEEEKEDNEDEEEDGWMVPHGYLSEDEGCNEDDDISPEKLKLQQLAKAKAWDEEQKRKFHALPIVVIGCFFEHLPSAMMCGDVRLLYEFKGVVIETETPIPTALSNAFQLPKCDDAPVETSMTKGIKPMCVPDEAMADLIRLLHGNIYGIKKLIKEFRVFWLQKTKSSTSCLDGSLDEELNESVKDNQVDVSMGDDSAKDPNDGSLLNKSTDANISTTKSKEEGHGCEISKRQLEIKIMAIAAREKRQCPKKTAWFVHDNVLTEFGMENIQLPNSWEFLTNVPSISPTPKIPATQASKEEDNVKKDEATPAKTPKDQRSIMDFTMTKEEAKELRKSRQESSVKSDEHPIPETSKPEIVEQVTPKEKKVNNQRSIMDFAKSTGSKSTPKISQNMTETKMETDSNTLKETQTKMETNSVTLKVTETKLETNPNTPIETQTKMDTDSNIKKNYQSIVEAKLGTESNDDVIILD